MADYINAAIPADDLKKVLDLLAQARAVLAPHLHPLTPAERQGIVKLGDKSLGFMNKLLDLAAHTPAFVPAFVDFGELKQDVGVAADLTPVQQQAAALAYDLESTILQAGAEGMTSASSVYKNIKFLAEQRQPGAQAAYDELRQRYPGRPAKKAAPGA